MNGRLAVNDLTGGLTTSVYQAPFSYTVATVNIVNRNFTPVNVKVAVSSSQTPNITDWIEYDTEIPGKGHLERTGVSVSQSEYIVVESSDDNVNCVVWGSEVDNTPS